jgi:anti-sigma B factor antagonist
MEGIQLSVEKVGSRNAISVIKVGGYIDTTTSSELEHALDSLLKGGSFNIIIDLANVDYVSSAGWGIFISEIKRIREKSGDLKLVSMIPEVYEVFELLEFHYILKAFNSIDEAIQDFERASTTPEKEAKIIELGSELNKEVSLANEPESSPTSKSETRELTLDDKIKKIVSVNPNESSIKILRILNSPKYGNMKIGWFGLRKSLKKLNLETKEKRRQFSRNPQ